MDFSLLKDFMDHLTSWCIPGNAIVVYNKGKKVFEYSSGYSDVESKTPMTTDKLLNIYSCSKPVTVVAALQLYEKGLFLLDDPLYNFIPEFREMYVKDSDGNLKKAENPITIRHLFTMTAGFTYNLKSDGIKKAREITGGKMDTVTVAKCMAKDPLSFEPGTRWQYSLCHDVLAAVVEVVSGQRFENYVKNNVFLPLGVTDIHYHRSEDVLSRMASQYEYVVGGEVLDVVQAQQSSQRNMDGRWNEVAGDDLDFVLGENYDSGGAGIVVSVEDYAKFANVLSIGGKTCNGERILSSGTIDLLRINQLTADQRVGFNWSQLKGYGYGLGVRTMVDKAQSGSVGALGEFGWGGAAGATLLVDPDNQFSYFYAHHMLNPQEDYYQPRLRNASYASLYR